MLVTKYKAVVIAVLLACSVSLSATSVVVLVTPHGIIVSTDSLMTKTSSDFLDLGKGTTKKFVIVQDRIVVATLGHQDFWSASPGVGAPEYHFSAWIKQVSAGLPSDITVEQFSNLIHTEGSKFFTAVVDSLLKAGKLPPHFSEICDTFIEYVVAGYQNGVPRVYVVQFYIDRDENRLVCLPPWLLNPDQIAGEERFRQYALGLQQAITDFRNRESYAYEQTKIRAPEAFRNLTAERDLSLDESISLAKAMIEIEEKTNPDSVGGKVQTTIVLPNGRASEVTPRTKALRASGQRAH